MVCGGEGLPAAPNGFHSLSFDTKIAVDENVDDPKKQDQVYKGLGNMVTLEGPLSCLYYLSTHTRSIGLSPVCLPLFLEFPESF